jgi:hypothetical protein
MTCTTSTMKKDHAIKRGKDMFERLTIINEKKTLKVTMYQERAIYSQLKSLLSQSPAVHAMTNRQKEEVTERLAIMFGLNYLSYMDGVNKGDERLTEQARQLARTYLEKPTGASIGRIQIGNDGLRLQ